VKAVYDQRAKLTLKPEERFRLENTYRDFVLGGAEPKVEPLLKRRGLLP
jgi:hypothetical protein